MRRACCLAILLVLSACAAQPEMNTTACAETRPQVCTLEYAPACAELIGGGRKEYASPCNACADDTVAGYELGPCPE